MTTTPLTHDSSTLPAPAAVRPVLLGALHGTVLEIGPGAGLNLRHYRPEHAIARAGFDDVDVRRYARPGPLGVDVPHIAGVTR